MKSKETKGNIESHLRFQKPLLQNFVASFITEKWACLLHELINSSPFGSMTFDYPSTFTFKVNILAESFYNVKYGSSIIPSKKRSKILSNENIKTVFSRKLIYFGILIHMQKHQRLWELLRIFLMILIWRCRKTLLFMLKIFSNLW